MMTSKPVMSESEGSKTSNVFVASESGNSFTTPLRAERIKQQSAASKNESSCSRTSSESLAVKGCTMGLLLSRIQNALKSFYGMDARILLVGLDAAGKTTLLYKMKLNETVTTIPTLGFNVETLQPINNIIFTVWDVGGQTRIRKLWGHYYTNTDGIVFMVDSVDCERFEEARLELEGLLDAQEMEGVPLLLLANKQDLPGAWPPMEVADRMRLQKMPGHRWHVQGCCAVSGAGIPEAMEKLSEMVKQYHKAKGK